MRAPHATFGLEAATRPAGPLADPVAMCKRFHFSYHTHPQVDYLRSNSGSGSGSGMVAAGPAPRDTSFVVTASGR